MNKIRLIYGLTLLLNVVGMIIKDLGFNIGIFFWAISIVILLSLDKK